MKYLYFSLIILFFSCASNTNVTSTNEIVKKNENNSNIVEIDYDKEWQKYFDEHEKYRSKKISIEMRIRDNINASLRRRIIPNDTRTIKFIPFENYGCFILNLDSDRIYKFKDSVFRTEDSEGRPFVFVYFYDFNKNENIYSRGSYFNINNELIRFKTEIINSSDVVEKVSNNLVISNSGNIIFSVTIGVINYIVNIPVIDIPVSRNSTMDELIEILGFPKEDIDITTRYGVAIDSKTWLLFRNYPYMSIEYFRSGNIIDIYELKN